MPLPVVIALASCAGSPRPIEQTYPECVPPRRPGEGREGDLERMTVPGPARCNDGSDPVLYARPATDPEHARDWVVYLEGGMSCDDASGCRERFCSGGHRLMTSRTSGPRRPGEGIASARPDNPFAGWNVAVLHYCSSDQWLGDAPQPVTLSSWFSSFTLWFQGHRVLLQLLDALDRGGPTDAGTPLPKLGAADRVLFAGSSAGGAGATFHLDDVAARYPDARVVGFVDGMIEPDATVLDRESRAIVEERQAWRWRRRYLDTWSGFQVARCAASGGSCLDPLFLWGTFVKSPAVLRFDLRDPVLSQVYTAGGGLPMAQVVRGYTSVGKKIAASARPDRGAVVTDCALHSAAGDDPGTFEMSVRGDGRDWRAVDAAWALLVEGQAIRAVDTPSGGLSRCPRPGRREVHEVGLP